MIREFDAAHVVAVAPMAGRGSRLGAAGSKEIVSLGHNGDGPAIAEIMLRRMVEAGLRRAVLTVAENKQDIRNYLGDVFEAPGGGSLRLEYVIANQSPNTVASIDAGFGRIKDRICALGFADILYVSCPGYARALIALANSNADIVLGLFPTTQPTTTDMVAFTPDGAVREILIKQSEGARYAFTWSLAVWRPAFTEFLHSWLRGANDSTRELFVGDVASAAQNAGLRVHAVVVSALASLDAGTPEALALARERQW